MTHIRLTLIVLTWVASVITAGLTGLHYGAAGEVAKQAKLEQVAEAATKAAMKGAAIEIAKIRVRNTTVQGRVQTIVRDNPVYRDCNHDDATLRLLNDTITGKGSQPGDSSVPRAVSPQR